MRNKLRTSGWRPLFNSGFGVGLGFGLLLLAPFPASAQTAWDGTIIEATTRDVENPNGFIDRIEIRAPAALDDSATSYNDVVVKVPVNDDVDLDYTVRAIDSCGPDEEDFGDDLFCVYLVEKTTFDTGATPRVRIENSGGLRYIGVGASADSNEVTAIDGAPPTVGYTLAINGRNEIYIHFSEQVYSDAALTPLNSDSFSLSSDPAREIDSIRNGDGGSGGNQKVLLVLDDIITPMHTFALPPSPSATVTISEDIYDAAGNQLAEWITMPFSRLVLASDDPENTENILLRPATAYNSLAPADRIADPTLPSVGTLHVFDGSRSISPNGPIKLQVKKSELIDIESIPEIITGINVDSIFIRNGLWLPIAVPDLVPASNSGATSLDPGTVISPMLLEYEMPEDQLPDSGLFQFLFRVEANYFATVTDSEADDWYERIRPYAFMIRGLRGQRAGISILKNVINPLKGERTAIQYRLNQNASVSITVFNLAGDVVRVLQRGTQRTGDHIVEWDGRNSRGRPVARGLYFVRFVSSDIDEYRKVLVVK